MIYYFEVIKGSQSFPDRISEIIRVNLYKQPRTQYPDALEATAYYFHFVPFHIYLHKIRWWMTSNEFVNRGGHYFTRANFFSPALQIISRHQLPFPYRF